jgi:predicted amidophosphoribosyltransferase
LIVEAKAAVLRDYKTPLFPDTVGPTRGAWWELDLLARVRGWDGSRETVPAPLILGEVKPEALEDVYAVGTYVPRWSGAQPLFSRYILDLKKSGKTISLAAVLLRQGLVEETDWIEDIDVIVPMPTSLRSFDERGFELTEQLASELGRLLCVPVVDALERDPEAPETRKQGGYRARREAVESSLRVKKAHASLLRIAVAVLVVDDVVTTGASLETCAKLLTEHYPLTEVYGAALGCTESPQRRERARDRARSDP